MMIVVAADHLFPRINFLEEEVVGGGGSVGSSRC